jgi:glutamyl-tRNA synthetase
MSNSTNIKVRFPPSPTGLCHVGTARMAVLNYLFAKKNGGKIIFRSEDTDSTRSKREFEDDILEQLRWLGLSWDEFYRTSELVSTHTVALKKLIESDRAFVSSEESKKEPGKIVEVVRLRNPGTKVTFTDLIRGDITFDTTELGNFTIARAIDDPLYHLAVVVDDGEMGVTHVIRGEDHISNTPRQILIQEALGYARPFYAHYPLHLSEDRAKLSKRTGDVAVRNYREKGYLPEALLNFIAVLGWTPPSQREILSIEDMIAEFEIADLHKSGAVFNVEKLDWFNKEYVQDILSDDALYAYVEPAIRTGVGDRLPYSDVLVKKMLPILRTSVTLSSELQKAALEGAFDYVFAPPIVDIAKLPDRKSNALEAAEHLAQTNLLLQGVSEFTIENVKNAIWTYATQKGRAAVLWPLRYALTGREKSPDPFIVASLIGKDATLERIAKAEAFLRV